MILTRRQLETLTRLAVRERRESLDVEDVTTTGSESVWVHWQDRYGLRCRVTLRPDGTWGQ